MEHLNIILVGYGSTVLVPTPKWDFAAFVQQSLEDARQRVRGIELATNAPLKFKPQRPDLGTLCEAAVANNVEYAVQRGNKLVDGIVATRVVKAGLQLIMPFVPCNPFSNTTSVAGASTGSQ